MQNGFRASLARLFREPILHFLLLGSALFAAYAVLHSDRPTDTREILVSSGQIEHLTEGFARIHQRPPTPDELDGLINDYVRGEVYNREARALGLDRDDPVIRNRLRQKMQFLSEDVAAIMAQPTDEQLRAYLQTHPDVFRVDQAYTFNQLYFNPDLRHEHLAQDVQRALEALRAREARVDAPALGDPFLLDGEFRALPQTELAKQFGDEFAKRLADLPIGTWQGPIESGYGEHLVLLQARTAGRLPTLEEARATITREWMNEERLRANEAFYQGLLKHYKVVITRHGNADVTVARRPSS